MTRYCNDLVVVIKHQFKKQICVLFCKDRVDAIPAWYIEPSIYNQWHRINLSTTSFHLTWAKRCTNQDEILAWKSGHTAPSLMQHVTSVWRNTEKNQTLNKYNSQFALVAILWVRILLQKAWLLQREHATCYVRWNRVSCCTTVQKKSHFKCLAICKWHWR